MSIEVFYCAQGTALVDTGDRQQRLSCGDALLIPPGVPHTIANTGSEAVVIVWAGAPGE
jgi:mannose-6-phosphate isomerase-like protein (cupin superfamily)